MMIVKNLLLSVVLFTTSLSTYAQMRCVDRAHLHNTGYQIAQNQMRHLTLEAFLPRNKKKSTEDRVKSVEANILTIWKKPEVAGLNANAKTLAETIVDVANKVGIDYQILAAIVRKESGYCMFRYNKKGGDSGCMQFTSPAITELKHQFGLAGKDKHSDGVPEILDGLIKKFYDGKAADAPTNFKAWLSQDIEKMKRGLRAGTILDFDILSGALFLKIKLTIANGNYGLAVRNYNGSSKKIAYQNSVMGSASKIAGGSSDLDEQLCLDNQDYENEIRKNACDLTEDPAECIKAFTRTLPNYT